MPAESGSAKQIQHETRIIKRREEKLRTELSAKAKKLEAVTVEIKARAGEEDKIFGSVTATQIAEGLLAQGHEVDRRNIVIEEPIRALGIFPVTVKLTRGIEAQVKVWVTKQEEEAAPESA